MPCVGNLASGGDGSSSGNTHGSATKGAGLFAALHWQNNSLCHKSHSRLDLCIKGFRQSLVQLHQRPVLKTPTIFLCARKNEQPSKWTA